MAETARNHIFQKKRQSSDNRSHGFGASFYWKNLKKLSASDFSYERKSAYSQVIKPLTESCAEKNCGNCETGAVSNQAVFVKYCPDFQTFFREIMKGISKFIFSVLSYMAKDFNNSRAWKDAFLELSYKKPWTESWTELKLRWLREVIFTRELFSWKYCPDFKAFFAK